MTGPAICYRRLIDKRKAAGTVLAATAPVPHA